MLSKYICVQRNAIYTLIFTFSVLIGYGQNSVIDSLSVLLNDQTEADTNRINLLITLSFREYGIIPDKAREHAEEALALSKQLHFKKGEGYSYRVLGICTWLKGESQKSVKYGLKMLSVFEGLKDKKGIASAYTLLAAAYLELEDYPAASAYLRKAIRSDKEIGNNSELAQNYNRYGSLFMYTNQYDSALIWYKQTLKIREEMNDRGGMAQSYNNIGSVLIDKKQYNQSIDYLLKALSIYKELNSNRVSIGGACQNLGKAYLLTGDFEKSELYLKEALAIAKEVRTLREQQGVYGVFTELEVARGNFKEALAYQKLSQSLLDSIYNEDKAKSLVDAEVQYETLKKTESIQLLEKENQIQSIWQYVLVTGVLFIGVIYFLQRSRTRRAKELLNVQEMLNLKLKETDQLKSRFFANISHEFRTPLSLILAPIEEKIKSTSLSPGDIEDMKLVSRNANRLMTLVNQLLDLSKIEAGKMELHLDNGNLKEFFQVLVASFESLAKSKGIVFSTSITLPDLSVKFDFNKLETIVTNVLFNAFKFTPAKGTVTLDISYTSNDQVVLIKIKDTGKGIPPEDIPHVFSPFYQSKHTSDDGQVGTGLGLALVNELVKICNGKIELTSIMDSGTMVIISIPLINYERTLNGQNVTSQSARHVAEDETAHPEYELAEKEIDNDKDVILIVEDNQDMRNFMTSSFINHYTIITASDGEDGFSKACEYIPDLIISDVMMPKMDGIEFAEQIKSDERTSHIPIILLTAKADSESRMHGLQTGVDDYLSKPFSVAELRARMSNLIEQRKKLIVKFRASLVEFNSVEQLLPVEPAVIKEPSLDEKFVQRARDVIKKYIGDSGFGVEKFADEMHLSRAQLFRKMKALMDTSPSEFINDFRLQRAAEMIRAKADSITQISYAVGFNEQSYFAKRFRKKYGVSPSEYAGAEK